MGTVRYATFALIENDSYISTGTKHFVKIFVLYTIMYAPIGIIKLFQNSI